MAPMLTKILFGLSGIAGSILLAALPHFFDKWIALLSTKEIVWVLSFLLVLLAILCISCLYLFLENRKLKEFRPFGGFLFDSKGNAYCPTHRILLTKCRPYNGVLSGYCVECRKYIDSNKVYGVMSAHIRSLEDK